MLNTFTGAGKLMIGKAVKNNVERGQVSGPEV